MKKYSTLNNLFGWIVFIIASFTYILTMEPTASFWDCGEFIACAFKLEVGHPPGNPFFFLVGRLFTLLAGSDVKKVPMMINAMSALASAFTILFLFWTITHLVKRLISHEGSHKLSDNIIIIASGIVGALAYTFSDTFWFSAVEGEVYASSSLFTAVVFWAILKWENVADEKYANRWLVLIAYLMGLSIGVHLLNLLAIPAIVLIYYFRKYKVTRNGLIASVFISLIILGGIMYILIPGIVKVAALFERIFVNGFGLPFWSGVSFYFILLASLIIYGINYTHQRGYIIANTALLFITVIIIGYSSYAMIVIRSTANPPLDENNPDNMFSLLSYLNREQYGDRPLFYGQYFNAPVKSSKETKPVFAPEDGKYKVINHKVVYNYDKSFQTLFPRIYSSQEEHIDAYLQWTGLKESDLYEIRTDRNGEPARDRYGETIYDHARPKRSPGFSNNIRFFIKYQLGHMYFRYFMWNFSGRQNDIQSQFKEEINKGNWITGIKFLDAARLGNQDKLTNIMLSNKARNKYFLLPLALGLIGLFFQYKQDKKNFWVVITLFFFTGIAIVLYLNQYPMQPRERDYAYAGSFYAFSIWIGIAVAALYRSAKETDFKPLSKYTFRGIITILVIGLLDIISNGMLSFTWSAVLLLLIMIMLLIAVKLAGIATKHEGTLILVSLLFTLPVPFIMANQNWDDHNRSGRYVARDSAVNYLNSCEKNAILYTNGDNDTFPLWYVQEVEGIRTDVRVINMSYLSAEWYIEQMGRRAYNSDPVKMTLTKDKYRQGKRDIVYIFDRVPGFIDLKDAIDFVASDDIKLKTIPGISEHLDYIPQHKLKLKADSSVVFSNGTLEPEMADKFTSEMKWEIRGGYLLKNHLMSLDFLATNNWERPIYFAITSPSENYLGMEDYFEMHGLAYRVVPALVKDNIRYAGGINSSVMYDKMINRFIWGGIENENVYIDENITRMLSNIRYNFGNLATALISAGKSDSARTVLDRCQELIPNSRIPYDVFMIGMIDSYYMIKEANKAEKLAKDILINTYQDLEFLISLKKPYSGYLQYEKQLSMHILRELIRITQENGNKKFSAEIEQNYETYGLALSRNL